MDPTSSNGVYTDSIGRLGLLASAVCGRRLEVAPVEFGEPSWTDGGTVFINADADVRFQLETLVVQASLLAAGSLEPKVVRRLRGRPVLSRRYLAVEGHRALSANEDLLPAPVRSLIDCDVATRSKSPDASLALALSPDTIVDPPDAFGVIRTRNLLGKPQIVAVSATGGHVPYRQPNQVLATELDDDEHGDDLDGDAHNFSSAGALGRGFRRMLGLVRQVSGGGPPTSEPAHQASSGPRGGGSTVFSISAAESVDDVASDGIGMKYPEWDVHRRGYRLDWCTVHEMTPRSQGAVSLGLGDQYGLRRPLARLGVGLDRCHRQVQGDDIDIDAAVQARVDLIAGSTPDEAIYLDTMRRRRDLAVLILLDVSGSAAQASATGQTVHEQQRAAAGALTVALHGLGDRVALYAFHSRGRSAVQLMPVKRFDDALDSMAMRRLHGLVPAGYSRLGAAIRHGEAVLRRRGGTSRRLLVVLSDGLAYDHGYEPVYGAADARRALAEARRRGIGCLCLTIGTSTNAGDLRRVFGSAAYASVLRPEQLAQVIGLLSRTALRSADVRRRAR